MIKRVQVSRRLADEISPACHDITAKVFTNYPQCVRVADVVEVVEEGEVVDYAHLIIVDDFPEDGFVATLRRRQDLLFVSSTEGCVFNSSISFSVHCEHGSCESLAGRDFQSVLNSWLDGEVDAAAAYLSARPSRVVRFLNNRGWWSVLVCYLRFGGFEVPSIDADLMQAEVDRGAFHPHCYDKLATVRIAAALGHRLNSEEPVPWNGLRDATELQVPAARAA